MEPEEGFIFHYCKHLRCYSYLHKGILCYLRDGLGGHPKCPYKTDRYDTQEISAFLVHQLEAIWGHFPFISKGSKGL